MTRWINRDTTIPNAEAPRMRIAHVTDFYLPRLGGIEMQVSELAGRQRREGHDVHVLTSSPGPDDGMAIRLTGGFRRPHALHPLAAREGIAALSSGSYDVVHAHLGVGSPLAFFAARAAARAGVPTIVTVHSLWSGVRPIMEILDAWGGWTRGPIIWTAVSEAAAGPVRRLLPPGHPIQIIPNGIDQQQWRPSSVADSTSAVVAGAPDSPAAPSGGGLDGHGSGETARPEVWLAAVMRLSFRKRPLPLLRMVRAAQQRLDAAAAGPAGAAGSPQPVSPRLRLVIAGDGPRRAAVERYAYRHGMGDAVVLRGRLDRGEVAEMLAGADMFVAPADLESFGIAALEARCAGLPVVAKASGGVREFITEGAEGLLCTADRDMVAAIVRLARDTPTRRAMAHHNRVTPCAVSWEVVLERTETAYRMAVQAQRGRAWPGLSGSAR